MKRLIETKPILHTMLWIMVYIAGVNIGDGFEAQTDVPNLVTALLVMGLSIILIIYLIRNGWVERFGMKRVRKADLKQVLYFVPLAILVLIQFASGIDPALSMTEIAVFCLLMTGVGFIEELLFRGFLYQAIEGKSGVKRAVLISGVTFGLGHIVNLMRGYGYAEQAGQIVVAVAVGIMLALIVARTGNIVPGILFHILFNVSGSVTRQDAGLETTLATMIVVISVGYAFCLSKSLPLGREAGRIRKTSTTS